MENVKNLEKELKLARKLETERKEKFEKLLREAFNYTCWRSRTVPSAVLRKIYGFDVDREIVLNNNLSILVIYRELILNQLKVNSKSTNKEKWKNWLTLYVLFYDPELYREMMENYEKEGSTHKNISSRSKMIEINKGIKNSLVPFGGEMIPEKLMDFLIGKY